MPPKTPSRSTARFFEQDVAVLREAQPGHQIDAQDAFPCMDPKTFHGQARRRQLEDVFYVYFTDGQH